MRVAFRISRSRDPDTLTAVLPDVPANPGRWVCYAHVGQHGECDRDWYYATRPARPTEYAALLEELLDIYGGPIEIVRRIARRRS